MSIKKRGILSLLIRFFSLFLMLFFCCGCQLFLSSKVSRTKSRRLRKPSGEKPSIVPQGSAPTVFSSGYNGSASIQFEPYQPVDLNENAGFYDGTAGGISFYYLPQKQIVWGYRVYLYFSPGTDVSKFINLNVWKKEPTEDGVYYCDFKAQYRPADNSFEKYYQPDPQTIVVDNIKGGYKYNYTILPLCITAKLPYCLDKNQKPFWYGFVPGPSLSFIWVDQRTKEWGAVQQDGGENNRGYYLVHFGVKSGEFQAFSESGGGGSGGGLHQ